MLTATHAETSGPSIHLFRVVPSQHFLGLRADHMPVGVDVDLQVFGLQVLFQPRVLLLKQFLVALHRLDGGLQDLQRLCEHVSLVLEVLCAGLLEAQRLMALPQLVQVVIFLPLRGAELRDFVLQVSDPPLCVSKSDLQVTLLEFASSQLALQRTQCALLVHVHLKIGLASFLVAIHPVLRSHLLSKLLFLEPRRLPLKIVDLLAQLVD